MSTSLLRTWSAILIAGSVIFPGSLWAGSSASYTLVVHVAPYTTSALNTLDSRVWDAEQWGSTTALTWGEFHGRKCLRASFSGSGTESYLRTDHFFSPEDWSAVTQVKVDVWVENSKTNLGLRLELHDIEDINRFNQAQDSGIPAGGWTTVTLDFTPVGYSVAKLFIIPLHLADGDSVCFSNLRLVRGGEEIWETFENPSYAWRGGTNYVFWKWDGRRNEPISHILTYGSTPGALIFPWQYGSGENAQLEATNLRGNAFSGISKFRARVYSDRTDIPIFMGFWDGSHWLETTRQTVSTANSWVQMEWDRPAGDFDWGNPASFSFMLQTATGTGLIYIDDLEFVP